MITIIDYGVGNLFSLSSALAYLGLEHKVSHEWEDIQKADRIILPGVGAFGDAVQKLRDCGAVEVLREEIAAGKPLLGICLGMQLLFEKSYEYGEHEGLGLIPGEVVPLKGQVEKENKVPHMGWNRLQLTEAGRRHPLFSYTNDGAYVYFVHSYFGKPRAEHLLAASEYQIPITAAVAAGNVMGTQFHPEKSGDAGLGILRAFSEI